MKEWEKYADIDEDNNFPILNKILEDKQKAQAEQEILAILDEDYEDYEDNYDFWDLIDELDRW